jgi:hypothetical protein
MACAPLLGTFDFIEKLSGKTGLLFTSIVAARDGVITPQELNKLNSNLQKIQGKDTVGDQLNPVIAILLTVLKTKAVIADIDDSLNYTTYGNHPEVSHMSVSWSEPHIYSTHSWFAVSQHHFSTHDENGDRRSAPALFLLFKEVWSSRQA